MPEVDMDRVAEDLAGVEIALARLDDGTYWTCELTGEELPDALLAADPVARRLPSPPSREPPS
jgi:RNA polymerase-binding transcription factor DksA